MSDRRARRNAKALGMSVEEYMAFRHAIRLKNDKKGRR